MKVEELQLIISKKPLELALWKKNRRVTSERKSQLSVASTRKSVESARSGQSLEHDQAWFEQQRACLDKDRIQMIKQILK